jgi:hypothetical protein
MFWCQFSQLAVFGSISDTQTEMMIPRSPVEVHPALMLISACSFISTERSAQVADGNCESQEGELYSAISLKPRTGLNPVNGDRRRGLRSVYY